VSEGSPALASFLLARYDEIEEVAREATAHHWRLTGPLDAEELGDAWWMAGPDKRHMELHDPATVLADIAAKRKIVEDCSTYVAEGEAAVTDGLAGRVLDLLVQPFADHPDFPH
jgi:hypothetical protein